MLRRVKYHIGNFLPALRSRNYRLYFMGQGISLVGTWMQEIAQQWLIYPVLTDNRSLLGLVSFINLAPTTALVLLAGVVTDRVNRRRALVIIHSLFAFIAFILWILIFTGQIAVWQVLVGAFVFGIVFAFDMPTRQLMMIELVEPRYYASALSLNAAIFNAARALGPALAGILIATIGIAPAYLLNSLSFLAVIASVLLIRWSPPPRTVVSSSLSEGFKEGVRYLWNNKVVAVLLTLLFLLTLFTWPGATLLPVFAHDIYQRGEVGFGLLQSAFGLGALVAALTFYWTFERTKSKFHLLLLAIMLVTVTGAIFSLSTNFFLAVFVQLISGWGVVTMITTANTLVQTTVPSPLRGRMISFYSFVLIGGMPFGALLGSAGVTWLGPRPTVFLCSVLFALTSFLLIAATRGKFQEKLQALEKIII